MMEAKRKMALIEYIEPMSAGEIFVGLGSLIIAIVVAYIFYRLYLKLIQYIDVVVNKEAKHSILEEKFLDAIATKKGFNLDNELAKRRIFEKRKKTFRHRIEEQIYQDMFGKDEKVKK